MYILVIYYHDLLEYVTCRPIHQISIRYKYLMVSKLFKYQLNPPYIINCCAMFDKFKDIGLQF